MYTSNDTDDKLCNILFTSKLFIFKFVKKVKIKILLNNTNGELYLTKKFTKQFFCNNFQYKHDNSAYDIPN